MSEQFIYSQKNNFSGGELTPTIEGRSELGLYQNGAKKLLNFIILPSGGVVRRHGTKFVHLFKENVPKKIISIMFSRELSYLLIFEAQPLKTTCSFFMGGELFLTTKVIKTNGNDGADFSFKLKDFSYTCFAGIAYISFGIDKPIFKFSIDPAIVEKFYTHLASQRQTQSNQNNNLAAAPLENSNNFSEIEKQKMFIIEPLKAHVAYYKQVQNNNSVNNPVQRPFNEVIYNADIDKINDVLREMHAAKNTNIYEENQEKLYATSIVTFENRLWCFGVNKNMHLIWASYKGDFYDFRMSYKTLLEARNPLTALSATFSSSTFDNVLWAVPFSTEMLLGTTDGIYLIKEGDRSKGEFIKIHKELDVPVSPIKPVIIGKTIFFVEGSGTKINSLYYSQEKGGFQLSDITAYSEHIFHPGISQIVGINSPFSMIFAVLKDGSFTSFTYSHDLKIMGWTPHILGGNQSIVLSITPVYGDNEDKLYFHVRRSNDIGSSYKEYLECLHPKYFTAKHKEMHKTVFADCYINILRPEEAVLDHAIMQAIKNDSSVEFRGGTTKLENIVQAQSTNIIKLNIDNIDVKNSFKANDRLIREYGLAVIPQIQIFLKKYYEEQMPLILEVLASCFALYRIGGNLYANFESIFSGEHEDLSIIEQLINDNERLSNDIATSLNNIRNQNLNIPTVLNSNTLIEYINNSAFSFNVGICTKIKQLDIDLIKLVIKTAKEILKNIKKIIDVEREKYNELREMHDTIFKLNKKLLLYYADRDNDNKQDLIVNLERFFSDSTIGFYSSMLDVTHPILTKYLLSSEVKELISRELASINQATTPPQLKAKIKLAVNQLVTKLSEQHSSRRAEEIIAGKRQEEICRLLRNLILEKPISNITRNFLISDELSTYIEELIENSPIITAAVNYESDVSDGSRGAISETDLEERVSRKVYNLMQDLRKNLNILHSNLIEYATLIMPGTSSMLLKDILNDERSIKLEKYLLLSKKYFPLFKKIFRGLDSRGLGVVARHLMPSFDQINVPWLLPIYQNNLVAIIGDEELHELKIIDNPLLKLKQPTRFLSVGFNYSSILQTFPFIFPDEIEHAPKGNVEIGVKLFNTKGGYTEEKLDNGIINKHYINSKFVDSDDLVRFTGEKQYLAVKEVTNIVSTPYRSGWVNFIMKEQIKQDVDFTFVVDKPYPATILKIYAKAKILPSYKGI